MEEGCRLQRISRTAKEAAAGDRGADVRSGQQTVKDTTLLKQGR